LARWSLRCAVAGHRDKFSRSANRLALECFDCGRITHGWVVGTTKEEPRMDKRTVIAAMIPASGVFAWLIVRFMEVAQEAPRITVEPRSRRELTKMSTASASHESVRVRPRILCAVDFTPQNRPAFDWWPVRLARLGEGDLLLVHAVSRSGSFVRNGRQRIRTHDCPSFT
jgi:hypothetical protein